MSDIILNQSKDSKYVRTHGNDDYLIKGSSIVVKKNIDTIKSIYWEAIIESYSDDKTNDGMPSFAFCDGDIKLNENDIKPEYKYSYEYNLNSNELTVTCDELDIKKERKINSNSDKFTLFSDVNATISKFTITKQDDSEIDNITNAGNYIYAPLSRTTPLIVTSIDKNNGSEEPLDISSSYRIITTINENEIDTNFDKYVFTNVERELFLVDSINDYSLKTEHNISSKFGAVQQVVFIEGDYDLNMNNFYRITRNREDDTESYNINDISILLNNTDYKIINTAYVSVNTKNNSISFDRDLDLSNYKYIIIDYLKDDCYSINPNFEKDTYNIDISTEKDTMYYFKELRPEETSPSDIQYVTVDLNCAKDKPYLCIISNDQDGGDK